MSWQSDFEKRVAGFPADVRTAHEHSSHHRAEVTASVLWLLLLLRELLSCRSYGYWGVSADADKRFDQATDFRLLRHFGKDPINGIAGHGEFTTGELWNLQDGLYYTSLWAAGGHPNSAARLGNHAAAEQWAVRRWVSTTEGPVTISGHAGKVMPWGEKWGGGCQVLIVVDGATLFRAAAGNQRTDYSIKADLKVGSLVDFLIGPDPSVGVIEFTGIVRTGRTTRSAK